MNEISKILPSSSSWEKLLGLNNSCDLDQLISRTLLDPVSDFFQRPGKNIRPRLVELGYRLSFENDPLEISIDDQEKLKLAGQIIELIHGGSLIVDDIQDGSQVRRNSPAFHLLHGLPVALNAGNWLYFWALGQVKDLKLSDESTHQLLNTILSLMTRAHFGQAIDLGTRIDEIPQERIAETCYASMELKTGTLMCLALQLGASVSGKKSHVNLDVLGNKLGLILQLYDDLGNFLEEKNSLPSKRHEDLYNRRPTWIWAEASKLNSSSFQDFLNAIQTLPDEQLLIIWTNTNRFTEHLSENAHFKLKVLRAEWENSLRSSHPIALDILLKLSSLLEKSYVKET